MRFPRRGVVFTDPRLRVAQFIEPTQRLQVPVMAFLQASLGRMGGHGEIAEFHGGPPCLVEAGYTRPHCGCQLRRGPGFRCVRCHTASPPESFVMIRVVDAFAFCFWGLTRASLATHVLPRMAGPRRTNTDQTRP